MCLCLPLKSVDIRRVREFKSDSRRVSGTATRQLPTSVFDTDASWRPDFATEVWSTSADSRILKLRSVDMTAAI